MVGRVGPFGSIFFAFGYQTLATLGNCILNTPGHNGTLGASLSISAQSAPKSKIA